MGIDVGFDLYPPLKHSDVDQWSRFLQAVCTEFASDAVVVVKDDEIEFQAGEHPTLYADPTRFRRFSSKVTGDLAVEPYIKQVYAIAKRYFGNRIFWWSEYCDNPNEKYTWSEVYDAARKPTTISARINFVDKK